VPAETRHMFQEQIVPVQPPELRPNLSVNRSANGRPPAPGPVVRGTVSPARALLPYRRRPVTFTLGHAEMQRASIVAMFSVSTRRPADSNAAATRKNGQTAEDNAAPEGPANTNAGTDFARAKIGQPPRRPRSSVAHGRHENCPRHAYEIAALAPYRRTKPKTSLLVSSSRGSMVSTVAARKQEHGILPAQCRGASVA
jgi:hypothetical protein